MKPLFMLALLALGLAGVVVLEITSGSVAISPAPLPVRAVRSGPAGTAEAADAWRAVLLGRPVFSPDRRPPAAAAATARSSPVLPRLSGVLVGPGQRRAIFADGTVRAVGSTLGRWRIGQIDVGSVTMLGPDGVTVLRPAFAVASAPIRPSQAEAPVTTPPQARPIPPLLRAPK